MYWADQSTTNKKCCVNALDCSKIFPFVFVQCCPFGHIALARQFLFWFPNKAESNYFYRKISNIVLLVTNTCLQCKVCYLSVLVFIHCTNEVEANVNKAFCKVNLYYCSWNLSQVHVPQCRHVHVYNYVEETQTPRCQGEFWTMYVYNTSLMRTFAPCAYTCPFRHKKAFTCPWQKPRSVE